MGLGKTYTGSAKLMKLGAKVNLVICQKSKINDWVEHFISNYEIDVFDLTKKKGIEFMLGDAEHSVPVIGVINYDLVWRRKQLLQLNDFTLMLDESSLIQHEDTQRTKFIMSMNPKNVILLSGTPTAGKYETLLSQMHLLGWRISERAFWNQYVNWRWAEDGFAIKLVDGYKNVERLKKKMRDHGCHFLKTEEVLDLPEQIEQTIRVPSTKDYQFFKKHSLVEIDGVELVGDTILTQMLYERQLCGQYNNDKVDALADLLNSTSDRLIVFYNFNAELEIIKSTCDSLNRPYSIINGQIKDLCAYGVKSDSVTIIQYQAGAMGLNLQLANKIVYFTPPLSSELFEQSKKRIHRMNQTRTCFYYYLTCCGSIEERIYKTLAMRRDYTDDLFREEKSDGSRKKIR